MTVSVGIASDLIERLAQAGEIVEGRLRSEAGALLDRESDSLRLELGALFDDVILIPPSETSVEWPRHESSPRVWMGPREITGLSALIVRGTRGVEHEIHALVQGLHRAGCVIADPIERFLGQRATKITGTVDRWDARTGTDSWVVGRRSWVDFLARADVHGLYPLLIKPLAGSRGEHVRVLDDRSAAERAVLSALRAAERDGVPLLVQRAVRIRTEWRVTIVNGAAIGTVERIAPPGVITRNAATGARYEIAHVPDVERLAEAAHPGPGIVGVDIARSEDGSLHVIEGNWACEWGLFEDTTKVNVARTIAASVLQLVDERRSSVR